MNLQKGFTLIELIIAITIVVILSAISAPIYRKYMISSKMTEAYAIFSAIKDAQMSYYNEYGQFYSNNVSTLYDPVLGIDVRMNKYIRNFNILRSYGTYFYTIIDVSNINKYGLRYLCLVCDRTSGQTIYETNNWNGAR